MKNFTYTIKDEHGIHARPAGIIVQTAKKYSAAISMEMKSAAGDARIADAKKLFAVMGLGAVKGSVLTLTAVGEDEEEAIAGLADAMTKAGL